jgi:hypothetical protein
LLVLAEPNFSKILFLKTFFVEQDPGKSLSGTGYEPCKKSRIVWIRTGDIAFCTHIPSTTPLTWKCEVSEPDLILAPILRLDMAAIAEGRMAAAAAAARVRSLRKKTAPATAARLPLNISASPR